MEAYNAKLSARLAERKRSRSPAERRCREAEERIAEFNANLERRNRLTPEEKLEEDGKEFSLALEKRPNTLLVLQFTPAPVFRRARCRVREYLYGHSDSENAAEIRNKYRVALEWDGQSQTEYYHVRCMECMIPLAPLARLQFKLEGKSTGVLLVGK